MAVHDRTVDTGGEFGVVFLFTGKTVRPARVRRESLSGEGCEGRFASRASKFATSVGSFDGQELCWRPCNRHEGPDRVDLKQLRHLVAIIDAGSLSRAAALVHVAQPALSLQVAALEAELGTRLLDRSSAGVVPTPAGSRLYRHAQTILRQVEAARAEVASAEVISGRVSVGLPTSAAALFAVPLLALVREMLPAVRLTIFESMSGYLEELLATNRLDLALFYRDHPIKGIEVQPLLVESLYLVSACDGHHEHSVPMEAVRHRPLVLPSAKHSLRDLIEQSFNRLGITLDVVADLDSLPTLRAAAERGIADTILPLSSMGAGPPGKGTVSVQKLVSPGISRPVALCRPAAMPATAATAATADLLAGEVNRMVADGTWGGATAHPASKS